MHKMADTAPAAQSSYGQILQSSALIGGASLLVVLIGLVRTKVLAVLLGPAGVGLLGLYSTLADMVRSLAEMGLNSSGVRQVAAAAATGDSARIARTTCVLRRLAVLLGGLGALLMALAAEPLARLTFGDTQHAGAVALLALAVWCGVWAGAQGALLQGLRRIAELAKMQVIGALAGMLASVLLVLLYGSAGVVLVIVAMTALNGVTAWWYSRRFRLPSPALSLRQSAAEASGLLKLGLAFMASALLMTGAAYAVRLLLTHNTGIEAAGLYQAAWTLGGLYVGFILQAMGADFYPRLTGVAEDNVQCNRLVNEQAHISLLLAGPGVLATLTLAPLVVTLFYSAEFAGAVAVLRWLCLGMALRVLIWPVGFILLAKGAQQLFFWSELAWTVSHLSLAWLLIAAYGLDGAGMAFVGAYLLHGLLVYALVRRLSGFRASGALRRTGLWFMVLIGGVFAGTLCLPPLAALLLGLLATVGSALSALRGLLGLLPPERMPRLLQQRWLRAGMVRS